MKNVLEKILIVDDSEINRLLLAEILKEKYEILEASGGIEAIQMIQEYGTEIALILLDIVMPDMDGLAVLEKMNQERWMIDSIPVIIISADQDEQTLNKAFELGTTDYMLRPFNALLVKHRVQNTIRLFTKLNYAKRIVELQKLASRDSATGLLNKGTMEEHVRMLLDDDDNNQKYAMMLLDVDNLKLINDTRGHSAGDEYIKLVARQMLGSTRSEDLTGRVGGDEFMIFFHYKENPGNAAQKIFGRILDIRATDMTWNKNGESIIDFSLSAGYATVEQVGKDYKKMFDAADKALYKAKRSGKKRCEAWNEGEDTI